MMPSKKSKLSNELERGGTYGMMYDTYIYINIDRYIKTSRRTLFDQYGARSGSPQLCTVLKANVGMTKWSYVLAEKY